MNIQKTLKIFLITLMMIIVLGAVSVYLILRIYNVNIDNKEQVFNIGLDFDFITMDDVNDYYANNIGKVDVLNYDLNIDLDLQNESINAVAKIKLIPVFDNNNFISLDFSSDFDNIKVLLDDKQLEFKKLDDQINIKLPKERKDTLDLIINYSGEPENKGLGSFLITDDEKSKRILTLNEPIYASTWFPCNDFPDDKAMLKLSVTNDSSYTTVSNGVLKEIKTDGGKRTFTWETEYPISTYLVGFYSAKYKTVKDSLKLSDGKTLPVDYYILNEATNKSVYDLEVSKTALEFFDQKFGNYPFEKEKYGIAEFDWQMGAIENQTIVGIGSELVSGNRFFSDIIIHEAAHHWWGNAVGLKTWKDIWLNEGFASYSEALYWENKSGRSSLISTLFSKKYDFNDTQLYDPSGLMFSSTIYNKGAWVLHMLRFEIGEDNFNKLLHNYYENYKYKNASTEDLKNLAEKISSKDLDKFFDQWIYKGIGLIYADYFFHKKQNKLRISQFQDGYQEYHFPLEVKINAANKSEVKKFYITSKDTLLDLNTNFEIENVEVDPNNWLLANFVEEDSK